ncbi:MAG TPA: hypothetical protein VES42_05080 [Pilimelia sp.]|nr:hypothetical protein [Pilimelia sp.]
MSDGQLYLDPQRAMQGARDMASAGQSLKSLRDSAGAQITSASAKPPWGKDDIGAAFEKEYRKIEQQTLTSWEGLARYITGLGFTVAQTVNNNVQADVQSSTRVRGAWKAV